MKGSWHGFDWDGANMKKCQKHGLSMADVEYLFVHDPSVYPDRKHSQAELRNIAIGKNGSGRNVAVVFTYRIRDGKTFIRRISAVHASKGNEEI